MTRDRAATLTAAVTLDLSTPTDQILHLPPGDIGEDEAFVASCHLRARISPPPAEQFDVSPNDWEQQDLTLSPTVRWSWYVTPKVGGDFDLTIEFQPILTVRRLTSSRPVSGTPSTIFQEHTAVHVTTPPATGGGNNAGTQPEKHSPGIVTRLGDAMNSIAGMVTAITGLAGALGGLFALRRKKAKKDAPQAAAK